MNLVIYNESGDFVVADNIKECFWDVEPAGGGKRKYFIRMVLAEQMTRDFEVHDDDDELSLGVNVSESVMFKEHLFASMVMKTTMASLRQFMRTAKEEEFDIPKAFGMSLEHCTKKVAGLRLGRVS